MQEVEQLQNGFKSLRFATELLHTVLKSEVA